MTDAPPTDARQLGSKAARGAVWTFGTYFATKLLSLAGSIALARILAPDVFGLVSIALFVLSFLDVLNEFGIGAALVQTDDDSERAANTAFTLSLVMGTVATLALIALAPLIADWFHEPGVVGVLQVLSLTFLIDSLGSVHNARLRRTLQFRKLVLPDIASSVVKLVVSVGLAWAGAGVWSVAAGNIASATTMTALLWLAARWVPRLTLHRPTAKRMIRFGLRVAASGLLFLLMRDVDYLIIGRSLPVTALAAYTLAFRLPDLAVTGIPFSIRRATFPLYARLQHDLPRLRLAFTKVFRVVALITTPVAVGLAITSADLVEVLFGSKWVLAGEIMPWLALYAGVATLVGAPGPLYTAIGRPGISSLLLLVRLPVTIVVLVVAVQHGVVAVAAAQFGLVCAFLVVSMWVVHRVIALGARSMVLMARTVLVSALGLAVLALVVRELLADAPIAVRLPATVLAGIAGYAISVALFEASTVREAIGVLKGRTPSLEMPSAATANAQSSQSM